jgi:hypothetical protein
MPGNVSVLGILENATPHKNYGKIKRPRTPDYHALTLCVYQYQLMGAWRGVGVWSLTVYVRQWSCWCVFCMYACVCQGSDMCGNICQEYVIHADVCQGDDVYAGECQA